MIQPAIWATGFVGSWMNRQIAKHRTADGETVTALSLIGFALRVLTWALALLFALDQLGFDIRALVTDLGIGGVAVALAVQNILSDRNAFRLASARSVSAGAPVFGRASIDVLRQHVVRDHGPHSHAAVLLRTHACPSRPSKRAVCALQRAKSSQTSEVSHELRRQKWKHRP